MKAITTKYVGPTDRRGSRIIASDSDNNRIVLSTNDERISRFAFDRQCQVAAEILRDKMGWTGRLVGGSTKKGYYFVMVDD